MGSDYGRLKSRNIIAKERRRLALELRKRGYTFDQIAKAVRQWARDNNYYLTAKYDRRRAWLDVKRELEMLEREVSLEAREVLKLEIERLDMMLKPVMKKAVSGDLAAIDRVLKIMERRDRLMHLSELGGLTDDVIDVEII